MPTRRFLTRWAGILPVALGAAVLPASAAAATAHSPAASQPATTRSSPRMPSGVAQAIARAKATGRPVAVQSLTTQTSQTTAEPDGRLEFTEYLEPVRTWQAGKWVSLDADLHKAGGRLAPQASTEPVSLSDGGRAPLAELDNYGRHLTLTWPGGALPVPVISGATATYRNVLPGVDLAVTVTSQGGISDVVIVHSAAAAASPKLATMLKIGASAPGMSVEASPGGSIAVTTGRGAAPTFTAPPSQMWDSAAPPAGTPIATVGGSAVVAPSGMPAYSGIAGPGAYARTYRPADTIRGNTITVTPPRGSLTAPGTVYPVYIDPTFNPGKGDQYPKDAAAWTQIDSGLPTDDSDWDESGSPYLQVGYCDPTYMAGCNGIGVTRTMFRFDLPSLPSDTTVSQANIELTDLWQSADCTAEPLQLWRTPAISSSSDWDNDNGWDSELEQMTFAGYGHSGCAASTNDVIFGTGSSASAGSAGNLASSLTSAVDKDWATYTFGLRAADESTTDGTSTGGAWFQWRYFQDTAKDIYLEMYYHYPPDAPVISTSPGGECQGSGSAPVIGDDTINISGTIADGDGDTDMNTETNVYNSAGTVVDGPWYYPAKGEGGSGVSNQVIGTIEAGTLTTTGTYHLTAVTTDSFGATASRTCYFYLDLTAPLTPQVSGLPSAVTLGQQITGLTFSPASGEDCSDSPDPCAAIYTYQIGDRAPVTVTANSSGVWTQPSGSPITIPVLGPFIFRVSATNAAGNLSAPYYSGTIDSTLPAGSVPDGYFSDGSYPDLLTTDRSAADWSVWLSQGTSNGAVGTATDIGGLGTGLNPGADGPGDWTGASLLHGDFTGDDYEDVMGYWSPATTSTSTIAAGTGVIIGGDGTNAPLDPYSGNVATIQPGTFCDDTQADNGQCAFQAFDLVYAGNASQEGPATNNGDTNAQTNNADVIGIEGSSSGSPAPGYELDLFTANETGVYNLDTLNGVLSDAASASSSYPAWENFMFENWQDFTLATAELPDTAYPNGDPSNTVLLALDTATGNAYTGDLFESVNPGCATGTCSTTAIIGVPTSTWTQVTGTPSGWASTPPTLASADFNDGSGGPGSGSLEIWTISGSTATAYTITGTSPTLTEEGSGSSLTYPQASWALNNGGANPGTTPDTATDSVTGTQDPIGGSTYSWPADDTFGDVFDTTPPPGSTATSNDFIQPATDPVSNSDTPPTLSIWFKTTGASEALVSLSNSKLSSGEAAATVITGGYDPVLYIGSDGKLNAEWWNGHATAGITSATPVNDGLWHHAVLSGTSTSQTLTVDNQAPITDTGDISISFDYFEIGAGFLGGGWPDEADHEKDGDDGYLTYFDGEIADVTLTP
jgi:Laminin G domain